VRPRLRRGRVPPLQLRAGRQSVTPGMRRLLGLTRPHAGLLLGATVAGIFSLAGGLSLPLFTEHLVNNAIIGHRRGLIVPLALGYLAVAAVRAFSNFLRRNLSGE